MGTPDPTTPYAAIGGEQTVRRVVQRFYELMDELPEAAAARRLYPPSLDDSRERLFKYLSGWLGGPPLYVQEHGHPRLRWRHLPFSIGAQEREAWMLCMAQALKEQLADAEPRDRLMRAFADLADHMVNRPQPGGD